VLSRAINNMHGQKFGWSTKNLLAFSIIQAPFLAYSHLDFAEANPAMVPSPAASDMESESPALDAARELKRWLNVTYEDLGTLTGVAPTSFYYWQREKGQPRPATTRDLFRLHAFVRSLQERIGVPNLRSWFGAGSPSPLQLLRSGNFQRVEELASDLAFREAVESADRGTQFLPDSPATYLAERSADRARPTVRRVTRTARPRRDR